MDPTANQGVSAFSGLKYFRALIEGSIARSAMLELSISTLRLLPSGKKPELYTETLLPKVAEGIAASEDPSRSYDRMIEVKVSFDTDKVRALEDTRYWAALALTPEEKMTVEDPVEMQRLADALPLERAASRWIVSSDADEHVERIGYYVGLGFRNLVFHAPGPDQARFLKLYGEHVLPRLRKRFG
jgi:coenzyme F420-dependent glucose-6-phosphate dehydrogenase